MAIAGRYPCRPQQRSRTVRKTSGGEPLLRGRYRNEHIDTVGDGEPGWDQKNPYSARFQGGSPSWRSTCQVGQARCGTVYGPSSVEVSPACVRVAGAQKVAHEPRSLELGDDAGAERAFGGQARV